MGGSVGLIIGSPSPPRIHIISSVVSAKSSKIRFVRSTFRVFIVFSFYNDDFSASF